MNRSQLHPHCAGSGFLSGSRLQLSSARRPWRQYWHRQQRWQATASASDAHSLLGVPQGAPKDVIKRAYRKLVLRTHPDIARDGGSEERFIQIQEAYETLIKRRGQPQGAELQGKDSWDFHDWHWRFRMSRAWASQHHKPGATNPYASTDRVEPAHRQQVQSQLDALRRKAAYRAAKRAASAAAASPAVECNSPPHAADVSQQHSTSAGGQSADEQKHADGPVQQPTVRQPNLRRAAQHPVQVDQQEQKEKQTLHATDSDPAAHSWQHQQQPQTEQQTAAHLPPQPETPLQPASQQPHGRFSAKQQPWHEPLDESQAAVPEMNVQTAAWLDALWQDVQRDVADTDGAVGAGTREQQDWLLYSGYESDWWDVDEEEPPTMEHLELLARLMHEGSDSSSSSAEDEGLDSRGHAGPMESVGLIRQELAVASQDEGSERETSDSESEEASGAESELSYAANERVRSQLAGLRRKARLR